MATRVETEVVPTKTISTTVVPIPVDEYRSYERKADMYKAVPLVFLFGGLFALVFFLTKSAKHGHFQLYESWIPVAIFFLAIAVTKLLLWCMKKSNSAHDLLLRKYGWKGEPCYRVEKI